MSLAGKTALVTGAGTGIGRATAMALGRAGVRLVLGNRNAELGEDVAARIRAEGGQAIFQPTDVTDPHQVQALVARAVSEFGGLQLAFNNAGVESTAAPLHAQPVQAAQPVFNVNVWGMFYCLKFEIEAMLTGGGGAIVNNSSLLGLIGTPNFALYVASKHAVCGLTKSAALEYAEHGIRVNAVAPGPIDTRMLAEVAGGDPQAFARHVPMKRIGRPEEVAQAVLWLLSDASSFVTGHVLAVDGGWSAK